MKKLLAILSVGIFMLAVSNVNAATKDKECPKKECCCKDCKCKDCKCTDCCKDCKCIDTKNCCTKECPKIAANKACCPQAKDCPNLKKKEGKRKK